MNPGTAIYQLLRDDAAVGQVIGNKIYPTIAPDKVAYPFATYGEFSRRTIPTKDGNIPTGDHDFDVDIYSYEFAQAQRISKAIEDVLDDYSGTINTVEIKKIRLVDQKTDSFEDKKNIFHITQEYRIRVAE